MITVYGWKLVREVAAKIIMEFYQLELELSGGDGAALPSDHCRFNLCYVKSKIENTTLILVKH
jgi:hypothetical protein